MRFVLSFLLVVLGQATVARSQPTSTGKPSAIDLELAKTYFSEARRLAESDGGRLWGKSLAGPLLFVEPRTRYAVANQADAEKKLTPAGGLFVRDVAPECAAGQHGLSLGRHALVDDPLAPARRQGRTLGHADA